MVSFCISIAKNSQPRESTYDGTAKPHSTPKVLIEKEKFFFKKFKETKKAFFTRKNALFYFYTLYYIYCIITHQPEQLHDGCKKQESNP